MKNCLARSIAFFVAFFVALALATGGHASTSTRQRAQSPGSRIDAHVRRALETHPGEDQRIIIRVRQGSRAGLRTALAAHGDRILAEHDSIDALTAIVHAQDVAELAENDAILSVSSDAIVRPHGLLDGLFGVVGG